MKKILSLVILTFLLFAFATTAFAKSETNNEAENVNVDKMFDFSVGGAFLVEASTGKVLYAENEYKKTSIASVTKIMTLILVCEALEEGRITLNQKVVVSKHAASMGGSQVFLEEGEEITVEELLKSTVIASGNDSAVALAELCAGSESLFVKQMNDKARSLGLKATNFENTTGLDDTATNHYSCPADIATMSRELIKHDIILKYSSLWQDTIRNGEFTLTNTNRLVRYYDGCNGLKTGSTDKAGFCMSATAKRGNLQLIAVITGARTSDERNSAARALLDYGFANYALYERGESFVENVDVIKGVKDFCQVYSSPFAVVIEKSNLNKVEYEYDIPEQLSAPVREGDVVGKIIYKIDGEQIGFSNIYSKNTVEKIGLFELFTRILGIIIFG